MKPLTEYIYTLIKYKQIQFLQILNKAFLSYDWSIGGSGAMVAEYIHGDGGVDAK